MPYIPNSRRAELDAHIEHLVAAIKHPGRWDATAGDLNYAITRMMLECCPMGERYWGMSAVRGVVQDAVDEFYRRKMAPYEDEQKDKSGDVYP